MYGVEAAEIAPATMANMSAAVIDVFKSRNDNHNTDRFFTIIAFDKDEIDPAIEVFARRVMQIRRTACKSKGMANRYKDMLRRYADKHMKGQEWPRWYQQTCKEDNSKEGRPCMFLIEQPHPSTNQHQADWRKDLEQYGPVGLLVESIIWHGMVIDQHMRIWQQNEEPIDILQMPYQSLRVSIQAAAARARTKAEWMRNSSKRIATAEIARDIKLQ